MSAGYSKAAFAVALAASILALPASAQRDGCGMPVSADRPCELTGHKLLPNPNAPELLVLQIETKQGAQAFVATRETIERFAKELLQSLDDPSVRKL